MDVDEPRPGTRGCTAGPREPASSVAVRGLTGRLRWLAAGQHLLRSSGIPGVKIEALAVVSGLTTGSFYHHFTNMAAYLDALARFWGGEQVESMLAKAQHPDPLERLRRLTRLARDEEMAPLDAAMRDWAGSDPVAAAAVDATDAALLDFLAGAFRDLGHDRDEARLRAVVLLATGAARVRAPWRVPRAADRILQILARVG